MQRLAGSIVGIVLTFASIVSSVAQVKPESAELDAPLIYHQITDLSEGTGTVMQPVLSGDGGTAAYAIAAHEGDTSNRIYTIAFDGSGLTEVDAYEPKCSCGAWVDISEDGSTVSSSDSMQIRLVGSGGSARTLVDLTSNEISALRLTADGERVFFTLARDTAPVDAVDSSDYLQRGIYLLETSGEEPQLIVGPDDLAEIAGVPLDQVTMLRLQPTGLDIAADGSRIVFGAWIGSKQAVFTANGDGGNLRQVGDIVESVQRVAMAGDGSLAAMDVLPDEPAADTNEIRITGTAGEPDVLLAGIATNQFDPLQLDADGTHLLISPQSYLVDTGDGAIRQLAVLTPGADAHTALLGEGMPRATMNDEATRFLYAMRTSRCADCPNLQEQLATLDTTLNGSDDAVTISDFSIDPADIPLNGTGTATASATIEATGELIAAGVVALRDGRYDINVARDARLHDDGMNGDTTAGDGTYTTTALVHVGAEAREDDTGPRAIRVQAEIETSDGLRVAIGYDAATLTVVAEPGA